MPRLTDNEIRRQIAGNEAVIAGIYKKGAFKLFSPEAHCIMRAEIENNVMRYILEGREYKGDGQ